jgi:DNA-binding NarL/FixJ family response regulator
MIRIVIICEQEQDRQTIRTLLSSQEDFQIDGIGNSGYDALKYAADLQPDIIIMDLRMTDACAADLAPIIKRRYPITRFITLSQNETSWVNALRAGISGFLLKQLDMDNLTAAVRIVYYGGYYFSDPLIKQVRMVFPATAKAVRHPRAYSALSNTSPAERKIINYLASGYSDKEIADDLHIAAGTIRNNMAALIHKAGLKNRIHVVIYAFLCGLITDLL